MDPLTDPLTDLLNGVRTSGAVFNQAFLSGAWAVRFEDGSPLALAVPLQGPAWVTPEGGDGDPVRLGPGDVAVLSGGAPYVVADGPATEPDVMIGPGAHCTTMDGEDMSAWRPTGPRPTGPGVARGGQEACPVGPAVFENVTRTAPGQQVLLDRMLDLMLITALRAWFTRPGAQVPAWYQAHSDPMVGPALRLLHADPAQPWTVETLAARTGVSRAVLARRFTALVGQPPMTYLREQRLAPAADFLREPGTTVAAAASRVGFFSPSP